MGTIIVQGTITTSNVLKILPELDRCGLNVKIVAAIEPEIFRCNPPSFETQVLPLEEWRNSTVISNTGRRFNGRLDLLKGIAALRNDS